MLRKIMISFILYSLFPTSENIVNDITIEHSFQLNTNFYQYEKNFLSNIDDFILKEEPLYDDTQFKRVIEIVYISSDVNVRRLPNKDSELITNLKKGTKVTRIGFGEDWSKIIYNNKECFIHSNYLTYNEPKVETPKVDISSCFVKKEGNVDDSFIIKAENRWKLIPQNVKDYLIEKNTNIYITDSNLAKRFYDGEYSSIQGVTEYLIGNIYLEDRDAAINEALIHECGHLIDYNLGWLSNLSEFYSLYESEKDSFRNMSDNHCISSSTEYFAETFNQTILNPNKVKQFAPNTYKYMINLINSL